MGRCAGSCGAVGWAWTCAGGFVGLMRLPVGILALFQFVRRAWSSRGARQPPARFRSTTRSSLTASLESHLTTSQHCPLSIVHSPHTQTRNPSTSSSPYPDGAGIPDDLNAFLGPSNLVLLLPNSSRCIATVALSANIARAFSAPRSPWIPRPRTRRSRIRSGRARMRSWSIAEWTRSMMRCFGRG